MARTLSHAALVGILALAASCGGAGPQGPQDPTRVAEDLGRAMAMIDAEYTDVIARDRLYKGAVRGMLAELDPHSSYFDAQEFKELQEQSSGDRVGIGVELDLRGGRARIIAPVEGSPAARAGVQSGDEIVSVDGHRLDLEGAEKTLRRLRGEPGQAAQLVLRRGTSDVSVTVTRESLHFACTVSKLMPRALWYLRIRAFQQGCHDEVMRAWSALPEPKPLGILLDMRGNPGGLVSESVSLADEWLERGDLVRLYSRGVLRESTPAHEGGAWVGTPTAVLMNRWSASAAEILAGALRDASNDPAAVGSPRGGLVVGELSYGKGTVQAVVPLPSGGGLALTIARYTTPSGRYIQGQGIVPHVLLEQARAPGSAADMPRESELPGALRAPASQGQAETPSHVLRKTVHLAGILEATSLPSESDPWATAAFAELQTLVAGSATNGAPGVR